jgi:hypothetical protein
MMYHFTADFSKTVSSEKKPRFCNILSESLDQLVLELPVTPAHPTPTRGDFQGYDFLKAYENAAR